MNRFFFSRSKIVSSTKTLNETTIIILCDSIDLITMHGLRKNVMCHN